MSNVETDRQVLLTIKQNTILLPLSALCNIRISIVENKPILNLN